MVRQNIYTVTYKSCNIRVLFTLFFSLRKNGLKNYQKIEISRGLKNWDPTRF